MGIGVSSRSLQERSEPESKCIGTRYAEVMAFEKGANATGVWHLQGSAENHKRFSEARDAHPEKSNAEVVALAGGTYHNDCKSSHSGRRLD